MIVIHSNMAWVCNDGDNLHRFRDKIRRRVVKGIRRAISTPWEMIERWTDQRRADNAVIG